MALFAEDYFVPIQWDPLNKNNLLWSGPLPRPSYSRSCPAGGNSSSCLPRNSCQRWLLPDSILLSSLFSMKATYPIYCCKYYFWPVNNCFYHDAEHLFNQPGRLAFLFSLSLPSSSWPQIHNPSASASRVLQLPVCATTPGIKINTYERILRMDLYINYNHLIPISYIRANLLTFQETL